MAAGPRSRASSLAAVALAFAGVGLLVAGFGSGPVFAMWRDAAARALLDQATFPAALSEFAGLTFGILGASIVGKWLAAWWLARRLRGDADRWIWQALVAGLLGWFVVDSGVSIALGAWFNVWMINLAPLLVFGVSLVRARPEGPHGRAPPFPSGAWRALFWVCIASCAMGLVLVVAPTSAVPWPYRQAIADVYFAGTMPPEALVWQRFSYALIGAAFAAHFAMLAYAVRMAAGRRWVLDAIAGSMLGWFAVDVTASLLHGATFNVLMIDLPSLSAVAIPWVLARRSAEDASP